MLKLWFTWLQNYSIAFDQSQEISFQFKGISNRDNIQQNISVCEMIVSVPFKTMKCLFIMISNTIFYGTTQQILQRDYHAIQPAVFHQRCSTAVERVRVKWSSLVETSSDVLPPSLGPSHPIACVGGRVMYFIRLVEITKFPVTYCVNDCSVITTLLVWSHCHCISPPDLISFDSWLLFDRFFFSFVVIDWLSVWIVKVWSCQSQIRPCALIQLKFYIKREHILILSVTTQVQQHMWEKSVVLNTNLNGQVGDRVLRIPLLNFRDGHNRMENLLHFGVAIKSILWYKV